LTDPDRDPAPGWIDLTALEAAGAGQVPPEARPSVEHHPRLAATGGNTLGIPSNRGAAFKPVQVSAAPPPPNRFLAADQRQRARLQRGSTNPELPPVPGIQPTTRWVEPEDEE
jgi:hypothetical protein